MIYHDRRKIINSEKVNKVSNLVYIKLRGEPGKRVSGSAVDTATVGLRLHQLIITDTNTNRRYLVYTSAQVSVIPASYIDRRSVATTDPIQSANGSWIATYGARNASLCFRGRVYSARLVIADARQKLLGADFLRHHNLLVDLKG